MASQNAAWAKSHDSGQLSEYFTLPPGPSVVFFAGARQGAESRRFEAAHPDKNPGPRGNSGFVAPKKVIALGCNKSFSCSTAGRSTLRSEPLMEKSGLQEKDFAALV